MRNLKIFLVLASVALSILPSFAQPGYYAARQRENNRQAILDDMERRRMEQNGYYNTGYGVGDVFVDLVTGYLNYVEEQMRQAEFRQMIRKKNRNALDLHQKGLSDMALAELDRALEEYPEQYSFLFTKGVVFKELGRYEEAEQCFLAVISNDPNNAQAYVFLGLVLSGRGDENAACYYFDKACQLNSSAHEAFYFRGRCRKNDGEFYEAVLDFSRVLKLKPNYRAAFYERAVCHLKMANYTSAAINLNQAIRYYPEDAELYNLRGEVFYREDKLDKALNDFNSALARQPSMLRALCNRSLVFLSQGKYLKAEGDIETAIRYGGEMGVFYYFLAVINEKQGETKEACQYLEKACEMGIEEACTAEMPGCN